MMTITFNMKGLVFDEGDKGIAMMDDLFQKNNAHHDIYVFASQEAERSIVGSLMNSSKDILIAQLKSYFGISEESETVAE